MNTGIGHSHGLTDPRDRALDRALQSLQTFANTAYLAERNRLITGPMANSPANAMLNAGAKWHTCHDAAPTAAAAVPVDATPAAPILGAAATATVAATGAAATTTTSA